MQGQLLHHRAAACRGSCCITINWEVGQVMVGASVGVTEKDSSKTFRKRQDGETEGVYKQHERR